MGGCFTPTYPESLTCSDESTCPPGQGCEGLTNQCKPECANGTCELNLDARAVRFESVDREPLADVTLHITSIPGDLTAKTDAQGVASVKHLAPSTVLELLLEFVQLDPPTGGLFSTRYLGPSITNKPLSFDIPVVEFRWLAQVATDCGIFPTLEDALYTPGTANPNGYFIRRATIIGEVFDLDGTPATLTRSQIKVLNDGWTNFHANPDDTDTAPAFVCMLKVNPTTGTYVGTTDEQTPDGRFVMFRVRNGKDLPIGFAQAQITGYPEGVVVLRSAGDIGVVRMQKGVEAPTLPSSSFAAHVLPLMHQLGCPGCHQPGQPGYEMSQLRGGLKADYSGSAEDVRAVLMADSESCTTMNPSRVCLQMPDASLFYTKPRLETGGQPDHLGVAFPPNSTVLAVILGWITSGAKP
ncbi:MAG: hypothetical protein H0T79_01475 [Deltaproteobacteria bacterium]|nr:hypothetical protein [Deltaproteobacteria bacterium]